MKKILTTLFLFCALISNAQNSTELLISNKPLAEISNTAFYNNKCYAGLKEADTKNWIFGSIFSLVEIDQSTLAYRYILNVDTNSVASDIVFQNTGAKLYCYYLSFKIALKKIYLQKIIIDKNSIIRDSVLINLPINQTGNGSWHDFELYKSKMVIINNELFSKIIYLNDSATKVVLNIQNYDTTLTAVWNCDLKSADAWIYSNNNKTVIYYALGQGKLNIKIFDKASFTFTDATNPILDIIPFTYGRFEFIHWNAKDYMVIVNDSDNDKIIDNTYLFSFITDSTFQLERTFSGGRKVHCFNQNDSLIYFALGKDSVNYLSFYDTSYSLINMGRIKNNKNGNRVQINNYASQGLEYWYFGNYFISPNYYPYAIKTTTPLSVKNISQVSPPDIYVYPNPTNDFLTIAAGDHKIKWIQILDMNGKMLQQDNTGNHLIDVSNLACGIYFISIFTMKGETLRTKFSKY